MKVLLVVVAAFAAVNAGPVPTGDLKQTAKNVLDVTKTLLTEIDQSLEISETVQKSSEKAVNEIPATVAANKQVAELKDAVSKAGKCQEVFDSKVSEFEITLENFLKDTVDTDVTIIQSTLGLIKKQLELVVVALTDNLDAEIEACKTEGSKCNITGDFMQLTEDVFGLVGVSEQQASHSVTGAVSQIEGEVIAEKIEKALVKPVQACLKA